MDHTAAYGARQVKDKITATARARWIDAAIEALAEGGLEAIAVEKRNDMRVQPELAGSAASEAQQGRRSRAHKTLTEKGGPGNVGAGLGSNGFRREQRY